MNELVQRMLGGDRDSLGKLLSVAEKEGPGTAELMKAVFPHTGRAFCVGVTGPPGAGKSTVVSRLVAFAREKDLKGGVVAVDPTSPFSGGAILGDRVRMREHFLDESVFIRSMATRGSHGGLPRTALSLVKLMDAAGMDIVFIETVGVGQTELDVMEAADTTIVVLVPEAGDGIQTMKAGLMEIADIFAVNKADRPGADLLVADIEGMLSQSPKQSWWRVPVLPIQALNNIGMKPLYDKVELHLEALELSGQLGLKRSQRRRTDLLRTIENSVMSQLIGQIETDPHLAQHLDRAERGEVDPYSAAHDILTNRFLIDHWLSRIDGDGSRHH